MYKYILGCLVSSFAVLILLYKINCLPVQRTIGILSQGIWITNSECGRCWRVWEIVEEHSTQYSHEVVKYKKPDSDTLGYVTEIRSGWGCFPLCETCWKALTIEERLPYYKSMIEDWRAYAIRTNDHVYLRDLVTKEKQIIKAVLEGK